MVDLASLALELAVWGDPIGDLRWLSPPPAAALSTATELLEELGAVEGAGRRSWVGAWSSFPCIPAWPGCCWRRPMPIVGPRRCWLHCCPNVTSSGGTEKQGAVRSMWPAGWPSSTTVGPPSRAQSIARRCQRCAAAPRSCASGSIGPGPGQVPKNGELATPRPRRLRPGEGAVAAVPGDEAGPLLAQAYPDRMAEGRGGGRYRLRHGGGAELPDHDPLFGAPWLVVPEVEGPTGGSGRGDGRIRLAAVLERAEIERVGGRAVTIEETLEWDDEVDDLRVVTTKRLDSLQLGSWRDGAPVGPATTSALVDRAVRTGLADLRWTPAARSLQTRAGWARPGFGRSLAGRVRRRLGRARRGVAGPAVGGRNRASRPGPGRSRPGHQGRAG